MIEYKLTKEKIVLGGIKVNISCLKNLEGTIDDLFSEIEKGADASVLEKLCPYFGVIWPAALALSEHMLNIGNRLQGARVLEVGCGLALPSITASLLGARVTATDFHPEVPRFLERNLALNPRAAVKYIALDWTKPDEYKSALGTEPYDWVIGSDILYEKSHPKDLAHALMLLAGKRGRIAIADPLRPYLQSFVTEMEKYGYRHDDIPVKAKGKDALILLFDRV